MTKEQLKKGEDLLQDIIFHENKLITLTTEFSRFVLNPGNYMATIGEKCMNGVCIDAYIPMHDIYKFAIKGVTKKIGELKKEFKNL